MDQQAPNMTKTKAQILRELFDAAVESALPENCMDRYLPQPPKGRTIVVGGGKAAAAMARALEAHYTGALEGAVVTRYGYKRRTEHIEVLEAAHPLPDKAGVVAAETMLELARDAGPDDLVICLMSGGGSALLSYPAKGISLEDAQNVTTELMRSGATIQDLNTIRKHFSQVKAGRLAVAAAPARLVTLAISDVAGDDPTVIASGPTVADPTSMSDVRHIISRFNISLPERMQILLDSDACETPKPGDPVFDNTEYRIIARPAACLSAAAEIAEQAGYQVEILSDMVVGEARTVGALHAARAIEAANTGAKLCILSGGEVTVTLTGNGHGGPNREYALALAMGLQGDPRIYALAADTDGVDGIGAVAGALIEPDTLKKASEAGIEAADYLERNDSGPFFHRIRAEVVTGPTYTNVNDFRALLIN